MTLRAVTTAFGFAASPVDHLVALARCRQTPAGRRTRLAIVVTERIFTGGIPSSMGRRVAEILNTTRNRESALYFAS